MCPSFSNCFFPHGRERVGKAAFIVASGVTGCVNVWLFNLRRSLKPGSLLVLCFCSDAGVFRRTSQTDSGARRGREDSTLPKARLPLFMASGRTRWTKTVDLHSADRRNQAERQASGINHEGLSAWSWKVSGFGKKGGTSSSFLRNITNYYRLKVTERKDKNYNELRNSIKHSWRWHHETVIVNLKIRAGSKTPDR